MLVGAVGTWILVVVVVGMLLVVVGMLVVVVVGITDVVVVVGLVQQASLLGALFIVLFTA